MVRFGLTVGISAAVLVFLAAASYSDDVAPRHPSVYFPADQIRSNDSADAMYEERFSNALSDMRMPDQREPSQPSLFMPPPNAQKHDKEYRATVAHNGDYVMAIRVYQDSSGSPEVVANKIDLHAGGKPEAVRRRLSGDEWMAIFRGVETAGLMKPPHLPAKYEGDCLDWVIEAREGARYELMSETCSKDPAVENLESAFLKAAGWSAY